MIRDLCERIPRWVPPTLFAAALVATIAVSVAPSLPRAAGLISDKWAHTLVYGINGLLAAWAFPESRRFGLALGALFLFGVGLEGVQTLVSGRHGSGLDAAANAGGLITAGLIWLLGRRSQAARRP